MTYGCNENNEAANKRSAMPTAEGAWQFGDGEPVGPPSRWPLWQLMAILLVAGAVGTCISACIDWQVSRKKPKTAVA